MDWRRIRPTSESFPASSTLESAELAEDSDCNSEATNIDNANEGREEKEVLCELEEAELQELQADLHADGNAEYVVKVSKSNLHRLHRVDGCHHA